MGSTQKIRIAARLRPKLENELDDSAISIRHSTNTSFVDVLNPKDPTRALSYPFTSCYDQESTQDEIFTNDVQPLLEHIFHGVTVTVFAYGVTSSGKTHTMQGSKSQPGIIPRALQAIFKRAQGLRDVSLAVSYMEIYKDDVYDLLVDRENAPALHIRQNNGAVFVSNLTTTPISTIQQFDSIYNEATKRRSVASTNLNHASSRSHSVLTITVSMVDREQDTVMTGKLNLVDLAGSENNKHTGNDRQRMQESSAINKSLSVLGQVVNALNTNKSRIPYRDSKLTRILQDALGGSSLGLLICNIAPGKRFRTDTVNTLNFATHAKNVENKPVVDERDTRPAPKPHFAAPPPPAPVLRPANISSGSGGGGKRLSMVPVPSKPRYSKLKENQTIESVMGMGHGLTEKEIDERIARAVEAKVEAEVAKRLAEREKEQQVSSSSDLLFKKHRDLDEELNARLMELEKKYERGSKESQLADVLSPVSKKKTGRAYVALARAHSEKGDLQTSLDLYRKAQSYVPENHKLRERILEIEYAVKNEVPFKPSPRKSKKGRGRGKKRGREDDGEGEEEEEVARSLSLDVGSVSAVVAQTPLRRSRRKRIREGDAMVMDED